MAGTHIPIATTYPAATNTELLNTISEPCRAFGMRALYAAPGIPPDRMTAVVAFAIPAIG